MKHDFSDEIEDLYQRLIKVKESEFVINAWSDNEDGILSDLFEFFSENFKNPFALGLGWMEAYLQIYLWEFQSFHEGVDTYYTNLYGGQDKKTIQDTADYLKLNGFAEVYSAYLNGALAYNLNISGTPEVPVSEPAEFHPDDWIDSHQEIILDCMLTLLLDHWNELSDSPNP